MNRLVCFILSIGLLTPLLLSACAGSVRVIETFPTTSATKSILRKYVRNSFPDPYTIRDAEISNSWRTEGGIFRFSDQQYSLCIWLNYKSGRGSYVGRTVFGFIIDEGEVVKLLLSPVECFDRTRVNSWMPFTEILNIT